MASNVPIIGKYLSSFVEKRGNSKEKLERMKDLTTIHHGFRLPEKRRTTTS